MVKLKPCPFCGEAGAIREDASRFYATCESVNCYCAVGEAYDRDAMPEHMFPTAEAATAAWNRRTARTTLAQAAKDGGGE